jgi:mono/diheme cytochrome c family protein
MLSLSALPLVLAFAIPTSSQPPVDRQAATTFNANVKPILQQSCVGCHRQGNAKGGLDLSTYESTMKGGNTPKHVVAGKPDESVMLRRIKGLDNKPRMPKGQAPLSAAKENTIRKWILDGAKKG